MVWESLDGRTHNLIDYIIVSRKLTPTIAGAERVYSMRVLGVTINPHLTMSDHVDNLIESGASSIYALRSHGLQPKQLQLVARMTTIASLLYASPRGGDSPPRQTGVSWKGWSLDLGAADTFRLIIHPLRTWLINVCRPTDPSVAI